MNVILSGGSCVGDGSIRVDPSMVLNAPPVPRGRTSVTSMGGIGYAAANHHSQGTKVITLDYQDTGTGSSAKEGLKGDVKAGVEYSSPKAAAPPGGGGGGQANPLTP